MPSDPTQPQSQCLKLSAWGFRCLPSLWTRYQDLDYPRGDRPTAIPKNIPHIIGSHWRPAVCLWGRRERCPARAGWEAPSPQSAGGALGRGHLVTGATRPDSTESWPTDTHHLRGEWHRPCLCLLAPHGSPDHSRHIWAGPNLLQPATFKTKLVIFPVRPHQGKEHRPPGYSSRK